MIVLPDVNVLLYAFHGAAPEHARYARWLHDLINGADELGWTDGLLTSVVRMATHPRVWSRPAPTDAAAAFVRGLREAPGSRQLSATPVVWSTFEELLSDDAQAAGNLVPDAWLAAVAIAHGASLATADRGMARWPGLHWSDPVG